MKSPCTDLTEYKPKIIILSSGGPKGLYLLGGLYYYWQQGCLDEADTFVGSSVGAIILALYASGMSLTEILFEALEMTLFNSMEDINIASIHREYGVIPNSRFEDAMSMKLIDMLVKHLGKVPTLKEFYELTGKRMVYCVVSLKEEREYYFDHLSLIHI